MKEKTREKIINSVLFLYAESDFGNISLSDIAKSVGISKPAIYRHFSSKEELFLRVEENFFDQVYTCLEKIDFQKNDDKDCWSILHIFFIEHTELLSYFMYRICVSEKFELDFFLALQKRTFSDLPMNTQFQFHIHESLEQQKYLEWMYNLCTSACFILEAKKNQKSIDASILSEKINNFVFHGWWVLREIPLERRHDLQKLSEIDEIEIPKKVKIFEALCSIIMKNGFSGITIERLSAELGLAKSSVYSYFSKKDELITNLVLNEIKIVDQILVKRLAVLNDFSEMIYVHLFTVFSYFSKFPSGISVYGWLRRVGIKTGELFGNTQPYTEEQVNFQLPTLYKYIPIPDFGFKLSINFFSMWISTLPVSVLIHCQFHHFSNDQLKSCIDAIYDIMRNGIKNGGLK